MNENELKQKLLDLAQKIGAKRVCLALQFEGLSPRQSERLSLGDHEGSFRRRTVGAVQAVLSKQGKAKAS
jgi:hypothetical protein